MASKPKRRKGIQETHQFLDQFSEKDLREWQRLSNASESYWVKIFYHLEAQQHLHHDELVASLQNTPHVSLKINEWCRIIDYEFSLAPLSAMGSIKKGGRFNIGSDIDSNIFKPIPAFYCAETYETAYAERFGSSSRKDQKKLSGEEFALRKPSSFSSIILSGEVSNIFDLRKASNLKYFVAIIKKFNLTEEIKNLATQLKIPQPLLISSPSQLKETLLDHTWREWPINYNIPSNSQVFGRFLVEAGFEGILYKSTKGTNDCLAIFLENLDGSDSYIEIKDDPPPGLEIKRLDSGSWRELC